MFTINQIRMIYIKRNLIKNLFQFFYPTLYVLLAIGLFHSLLLSEPEQVPKFNNSSSYSLFQPTAIPQMHNTRFGVICSNKTTLKKYIKFSKQFFCNNETLCKIKGFNNTKTFLTYINSNNYIKQKQFDSVVQIYGAYPNLKFTIRDSNMEVKNVYDSANILTFHSPFSKQTTNSYYWKNYQMIFSNFIIFLTEKKVNRKIIIEDKVLKTPPIYNILSSEGLIKIVPLLISISYSSTLFTFVIWMVSEKEKKLDELLFRQGISQKQYLMSWAITFILLTIVPTTASSYLLAKFFFKNIKFTLIFITLFLFTLNIFGMSFLFQSFIQRVQTGQTILKIIYIGITILSSATNGPEIPKIAKYILSIFPQITLLSNFETMLVLDNYPKIDYTLLKTEYNKISLIETFIIFYFTSIAYIFFSVLVVM